MNGQRHVNVVFKGGGAKGAAYAGAVRALEEADFTIRSAAGSSAGAITAALVVAGCSSTVLASMSTTVMTKLRPRPVRTRMSAVFDPTLLGVAIEEQLRKAIGRSIGVDRVTFGELFVHTGRGLYIVTLDLATSQPRIFHHLMTPDISVTDAVLASCAIPGLFPPGRLVVDRPDGRVVHDLVDGGAWANFPLFIYTDPGFRAWLLDASTGGRADNQRSRVADLLDAETGTGRETIAFDLAPDDVVEACSGKECGFIAGRRGRQWDLGPAGSAGKSGTYLSAVLLGGRTRYVVLLAATVWVMSTAASWPDTVRAMNASLVRLPSPLFAAATTLVAVAAALLVLTVLATVVSVLMVGRLVSDTVVPAATSAFGVATGVVPWASAYRSVLLVRLPTAPMTTTRFRASHDVLHRVIERAAQATHAQLGTVTTPDDRLDDAHPSPSVERLGRPTRAGALMGAVALVAVVVGWMLRAISIGPELVRVVLLASAAVVGPVLAVQHAAGDRRRGATSSTRSTARRRGFRWPVFEAAVGVALLTGAVGWVLAHTGADHPRLVRAVVESGARTSSGDRPQGDVLPSPSCAAVARVVERGPFIYTIRATWAADDQPVLETSFQTRARLKIGDTVLVRRQPCLLELAEKSGGANNLVPLMLVTWGVSLLGGPIRRFSWSRRARWLDGLHAPT